LQNANAVLTELNGVKAIQSGARITDGYAITKAQQVIVDLLKNVR